LIASTRGIRRLISRSFLVPKTLATKAFIKARILEGRNYTQKLVY
jgi:hypothetical protein